MITRALLLGLSILDGADAFLWRSHASSRYSLQRPARRRRDSARLVRAASASVPNEDEEGLMVTIAKVRRPLGVILEEREDGRGVEVLDIDPSGNAAGVVSASVSDWGVLAAEGLAVDVVLASEVLYDPDEAAPLALAAARLLPNGGALLLADPAAGRAVSARAAATRALEDLGAVVSETPLEAAQAGDGWYSVRAGGGDRVDAGEAIVLLKAEWKGPPAL